MKIIYNAERAMQHKKEIDAEVAQENKDRRKSNRIKITIGILLTLAYIILCSVGAVWLWPFVDGDRAMFVGCIVLLYTFLTGVTWYVTRESLDWYLDDDSLKHRYTPDIKYFLATKGKRILKQDFARDREGILLTLEDENHFVTTDTIWVFNKKINTSVSEVTFDLEHSIVLIPYEKENKE